MELVFPTGIRTSSNYEVLDADACPVPGLYCVGALARGHCWELTAVGELRSAVYALSRRLCDRTPDRSQRDVADAPSAYRASC